MKKFERYWLRHLRDVLGTHIGRRISYIPETEIQGKRKRKPKNRVIHVRTDIQAISVD